MNKNITTVFLFFCALFFSSTIIAGEKNGLTKNGEQVLREFCQRSVFYEYTLKNFDFYKAKYSEFLIASKETSSPMDNATSLIARYWDIEDKDRESQKNTNETDQSKMFSSMLFTVQLETSRTLFLKYPLAKDRQFLQSEAKNICSQNISKILGVSVGR
jgi:hypothetical protein